MSFVTAQLSFALTSEPSAQENLSELANLVADLGKTASYPPASGEVNSTSGGTANAAAHRGFKARRPSSKKTAGLP